MKRPGKTQMRSRQSGFTLFELAIVLAILSILAILAVPNFMDEFNEKRAAVTIKETDQIMDAARAFRADTGTWPGQPNCSSALAVLRTGAAPYLGGSNTNNRYNSPYITGCTANSFSITQSLIPDFDGVIANGLPGTLISAPATNTITSIAGIPGSEPALDGKLSRVSTGDLQDNRMATNLLLGNNNIEEVNSINVGTVNSNRINNTGTITTDLVNAGVLNSNTLTTGNMTATNINASSLTATGNIKARGQLQADNGAVIVGDALVDGQVLARQLGLQGTAVEGGGCVRSGNLSTTTGGLSLSCQRGKWTRSSNWFDAPVSGGSGCLGSAGKGSFAVGSNGKLYVCR
jgi:prepilin-type N-terminal cleavage/methylation domain-containing protein